MIRFLPFYLLSFLPTPFLLWIADVLFILVYYVIGYRKKVVMSNLRASFPNENSAQLQERQRRFYRHFAQVIVLGSKVLSISRSEAKRRVTFKNIELLNGLHDEGKNVVLYGAHMGNWEWFAYFPLHIKHQFVSFYQEQSNAYFNALSIRMRQRFGNICLESRTAYKNLIKMNREGTLTLTYILGDQSPMAHSSMSWQTFLGQPTAFLIGGGRIAAKLGHHVIYPFVRMPKRGFYEVEFIEIPNTGDQDEVIAEYARLLERNIREQSELWLWSHRRWKISPESTD